MDDQVNQTIQMKKSGVLLLSKEHCRRWGLAAGSEVVVRETSEGLLLVPSDPPLTKVYVEPTTSCNLNCRTCIRNSWDEPPGRMRMTTYRRLIEGLRKVKTLKTMAFWGFGEPLLHPDIIDMIRLAKTLGVRTELITNGLLLSRKMADGLVKAGLDTLVVSIDGTEPESYGSIRKGADLQAVQNNVKTLHASRHDNLCRNPELGIEFVLMRKNVHELSKLPSLAYQLDANFIVVTNVLPYTKELSEEILYWLSAANFFTSRGSRWFPEIILPRMDANTEQLEPLVNLLGKGNFMDYLARSSDCAEGYCRFVNEGKTAIPWDGRVSPCVALMHSYTCYVMGRKKDIRRYTIGNVGRDKINQIWNSEEYRQFRRRVIAFDFSPCVHCGGCEWAESNEEDCFGNSFPVCGDCLWARGVILCP